MPVSVSNTSISGARRMSDRMTNIAQNISNGATNYFKREETIFSTFVTGEGLGGGVLGTQRRYVDQQGVMLSTESQFDLSIAGDGFFAVSKGGSGAEAYVRGSQFQVDENGELLTPDGWKLMGWQANAAGVVDTSTPLSGLTAINPSAVGSTPKATASLEINANLPANSADGTTHPVQTTIYDSLGVAHLLQVNFVYNDADSRWDMTVNNPTINGIDSGTVTAATRHITFNTDGTPNTITAPPIVITGIAGASNLSISLDLGTANQADGITQHGSPFRLSSMVQDGFAAGRFSSLTMNSEGQIHAIFENGSSRLIAQVPLVDFISPNSLLMETGNIYRETADSGAAQIKVANTEHMGRVLSYTVEASTTDIASEFTTMVQTQQLFVANTKVIKVSNEMDEVTTQIIR